MTRAVIVFVLLGVAACDPTDDRYIYKQWLAEHPDLQRHEAQKAACRAEVGYPAKTDYGTIVTPENRSYSKCMTDAGFVP